MKVQLTRDCIIGPSETRGQINAGKAGQVVEVQKNIGDLLVSSGCATSEIKEIKPTK